MPPRKSGISAATLVLSDEFGHMIDMPFLTIHLRSRQGQFSVSASDACASLPFARGTAVMLASPLRDLLNQSMSRPLRRHDGQSGAGRDAFARRLLRDANAVALHALPFVARPRRLDALQSSVGGRLSLK